jgi:hypothetical protein
MITPPEAFATWWEKRKEQLTGLRNMASGIWRKERITAVLQEEADRLAVAVVEEEEEEEDVTQLTLQKQTPPSEIDQFVEDCVPTDPTTIRNLCVAAILSLCNSAVKTLLLVGVLFAVRLLLEYLLYALDALVDDEEDTVPVEPEEKVEHWGLVMAAPKGFA